jgi:hypothetical protein
MVSDRAVSLDVKVVGKLSSDDAGAQSAIPSRQTRLLDVNSPQATLWRNSSKETGPD